MKPKKSPRTEFSEDVKLRLGKRAGFLCSICRCLTFGPSSESPASFSCVGVAAHITAAAGGGPRYTRSISPKIRAGVTNGIWLCQNHAKQIDDDMVRWTTSKLKELKRKHEAWVATMVGVDRAAVANKGPQEAPIANEFAFVTVRDLVTPYREFIGPILVDRHLGEDAELGILMCGASPEGRGVGTSWTVLVDPVWLRWIIQGQQAGHPIAENAPGDKIYGMIPAWPDTFFEFLTTIVETNSTFEWTRHPQGFLVLGQRQSTRG